MIKRQVRKPKSVLGTTERLKWTLFKPWNRSQLQKLKRYCWEVADRSQNSNYYYDRGENQIYLRSMVCRHKKVCSWQKHFCFAKNAPSFCKKLVVFFHIPFPFAFFNSSVPHWNFHSTLEKHGILFLPGSEIVFLYGSKPSKLYRLFINLSSTPSFL